MIVKKSLARAEALTGVGFLLPSLIGFLLFYAAPFVLVIVFSLTRGVYLTQFVGFENYANIFKNPAFLLAVTNTLRFELVSVPLICILSFFLALGLHRAGNRHLRTAFIIPLILPVVSISIVFQIAFADNGPFSRYLDIFGVHIGSFLHSSSAFFVLLALFFWKNIGYTVILFMGGLSVIPQTYYQAARVDGANTWAQIRYITLPQIAPTAFFVLIIAIIRSFSSFREAYMLAGDYPDQSIYMLQHFLNNNFQNLNYQRLSVAAILVFLVIFVCVWLLYRLQNSLEGNAV